MPTPVRRKRPSLSGKDLSVMAWIEDIYGGVLFVKQAQGRKLWALPGGKVRRNESLAAALAREIHEETGLRITHFIPVDFFDRYKKGSLTVLFRVRVRGRLGKLDPDIAEEITDVVFKNQLPRNHTPSAGYFYQRIHRHPGLIPARA
ncbi:MAG: NUDIX hydrolase [Candidatus Methylacidiphilales bacterium]|nr:NUDIX hydrolase [Candidatus Methylacidiphilales bacterium]